MRSRHAAPISPRARIPWMHPPGCPAGLRVFRERRLSRRSYSFDRSRRPRQGGVARGAAHVCAQCDEGARRSPRAQTSCGSPIRLAASPRSLRRPRLAPRVSAPETRTSCRHDVDSSARHGRAHGYRAHAANAGRPAPPMRPGPLVQTASPRHSRGHRVGGLRTRSVRRESEEGQRAPR